MQLATLRLDDGTTRAAVRDDDVWRMTQDECVDDLLRRVDAEGAYPVARPTATGESHPVASARFAAPLLRPGKIVCCGLNYADHILEMGRNLPAYPTLFAKFADTLTGPEDDIVIPAHARAEVDWEAELAVVVGATLRHVDEATAAAGIAGYTVANDLSMRDWQNRTLQWMQGKIFDGTTPLGPVVVTPDELDPTAGTRVSCDVDGQRRQDGDTAQLVFGPAALLAYVSSITTLRPGDVVLTGTPGGVGMGRTPRIFLTDGAVVTTAIDGIGELRNTIRFSEGEQR